MEKRRPKAGTVVMIALLLALTGVCVYLAPRTRDAYQEYRTESEATPTPTAACQRAGGIELCQAGSAGTGFKLSDMQSSFMREIRF